MKPYLLQDEELKELVVKIPGWEINNEQIQREFKFFNFFTTSYLSGGIVLFCFGFSPFNMAFLA